MIGETIGNFRVVSKLGQGGMGEVFLAEQKNIKTRVAIKTLLPHISANTDIVTRFFNEAVAVSRITHSGIAKIFDVGFLPSGQAYLVMEFLDGESLANRVARSGRLALGPLCDIGRQISSVLDATQQAGITHRDLKPDNIYLVRDTELDSGERVKILDFGIAKLSGAGGGMTASAIGSMGTPGYMSPEQWHNSKHVDWRADAYSLGCLTFEMAAGRPPFVADSIAEACTKHLTATPQPLRELVPAVPEGLEVLVAQLLEKDVAKRPGSLREIMQRFADLGRGQQMAVGATMFAGSGSMPAAAAASGSLPVAATVPPTMAPPTPGMSAPLPVSPTAPALPAVVAQTAAPPPLPARPAVSMPPPVPVPPPQAAAPRRVTPHMMPVAQLQTTISGAARELSTTTTPPPARSRTLAFVMLGSIGLALVVAIVVVAMSSRGGHTPMATTATSDAPAAVADASVVAVVAEPPTPTPRGTTGSTVDAAVADAPAAPIAPITARPTPSASAKPPTPTPTPTPTPPPPSPPADPAATPAPPAVGTCDEVSCVLANNVGPCCAKFKKGATQPRTVVEKDPNALPESLDRDMINNGVGTASGAAKACGDKFPAKGKVKLHIKVGPGGNVVEVSVGETPDAGLGNCVAAALQRAHFAKTQSGGSFAYPFVF